MEQHAVFAFLSVFLPLAYAFPAAVETSSSASRFNVGLSSSFNHLDVASQKIENQPTLVNSKLTSVSNQQLGALEALTNPVEKIGTSNPKLGLISHIQVRKDFCSRLLFVYLKFKLKVIIREVGTHIMCWKAAHYCYREYTKNVIEY